MDDRYGNVWTQTADDDALPTATIAAGGVYFAITAGKCYRPEMVHGKRGEITHFSNASRRRLMRLMAQIDRTVFRRRPLFITLTYPAKYPTSSRVYKAHLRSFLSRFARRYPHVPIIWRLEYQKRGAPHYHLMVFSPWYIDYKWVAETWYAATGRGDVFTLISGTETRAVRSWRGVMYYASKYMSKGGEVPSGHKPGRLWGVHSREDLPIRLQVITLEWSHFATLQQWLWEWHARNGREVLHQYKYKGASAYMPEDMAYLLVQRALLRRGASNASCIETAAGH